MWCALTLRASCASHLHARALHTTTRASTSRDHNVITPEDRGQYGWRHLKREVFEKYTRDQAEAVQAEVPQEPENVTFTSPELAVEDVTVKYPSIAPYSHIKTVPAAEKLSAPPRVPLPRAPKIDAPNSHAISHGTGRRKRARVTVSIRPGAGNIQINGRNYVDYFPSMYTRTHVIEPLVAAEMIGKVDIVAAAEGGGYMGQAGALRHAIAVSLVNRDPELRYLMHTTRMSKMDGRVKERKHTGFRAARRKQQWVKR